MELGLTGELEEEGEEVKGMGFQVGMPFGRRVFWQSTPIARFWECFASTRGGVHRNPVCSFVPRRFALCRFANLQSKAISRSKKLRQPLPSLGNTCGLRVASRL